MNKRGWWSDWRSEPGLKYIRILTAVVSVAVLALVSRLGAWNSANIPKVVFYIGIALIPATMLVSMSIHSYKLLSRKDILGGTVYLAASLFALFATCILSWIAYLGVSKAWMGQS